MEIHPVYIFSKAFETFEIMCYENRKRQSGIWLESLPLSNEPDEKLSRIPRNDTERIKMILCDILWVPTIKVILKVKHFDSWNKYFNSKYKTRFQ